MLFKKHCKETLQNRTLSISDVKAQAELSARAIDWGDAKISPYSEIVETIDLNQRLKIIVDSPDVSAFELAKIKLGHYGKGKSQFTVRVDRYLTVTVRNRSY